MSSLTRGPLSAGVYWRRRVVALLGALSLVVMLGGLLTGGSDGSSGSGTPTAEQAAAVPSTGAQSPTAARAAESLSPDERKAQRRQQRKAKRQAEKKARQEVASPTPLAAPNGPCVDRDLVVTPVVTGAVAGRDVPIVLQLRTILAEACTWRVSAEHVTLKITSGEDEVWTSLDCPGQVPVRDVVVRRDVTSTVALVWRNGKRSDDTCSALTDWALPGAYEIVAAAFGGEPTEATFELASPEPEVIEIEPKPEPGAKGKKQQG